MAFWIISIMSEEDKDHTHLTDLNAMAIVRLDQYFDLYKLCTKQVLYDLGSSLLWVLW